MCMKRMLCLIISLLLPVIILSGCRTPIKDSLVSQPPIKGGEVVVVATMFESGDPYNAGYEAARRLQVKLCGVMPHVIIMFNCFYCRDDKERLINGISEVFSRDLIIGGSVDGVYTQDGVSNYNGVGLLALGGDGIQVKAALIENISDNYKNKLIKDEFKRIADNVIYNGKMLAMKFPDIKKAEMLLLLGDLELNMSDFLIKGIYSISGEQLAIAGGSVKKKNGSGYICYRGSLYQNSLWGLTLRGDRLKFYQCMKSFDDIKVYPVFALEAINELNRYLKPKGYFAFGKVNKQDRLSKNSSEFFALNKISGNKIPLFVGYCSDEFSSIEYKMRKNSDVYARKRSHITFYSFGKRKDQ